MEPLGFKRGMTELMDQGLDVEVMATEKKDNEILLAWTRSVLVSNVADFTLVCKVPNY